VQAASKDFLKAFKAKFNADPLIYAPFTYDAANLIITAMQKADSVEPAKYLPELAKLSFHGASGSIEFDQRGDRKDAEMTIFTMKGGTITPIAILKSGKSTKFEDFVKGANLTRKQAAAGAKQSKTTQFHDAAQTALAGAACAGAPH
jgi:branched-chain amino acid transport system substrate-binding protein